MGCREGFELLSALLFFAGFSLRCGQGSQVLNRRKIFMQFKIYDLNSGKTCKTTQSDWSAV